MHTKYGWLAVSLALILSLLLRPGLAAAQGGDADSVYFPETGHWVAGEFLQVYENASEPEFVYGYPITEAFQDQALGRVVQYFQRARFELHPENPPELRVVVSLLGTYLYIPGPLLPVPEQFPDCKLYPETGFRVCYAFLTFFEENGGAAQFGYPISNFEIHAGRIMQYFQRARLEWHPERPAGQKVTLSDLGKMYFDTVRENPARLLPAPIRDNQPQAILSLQARAFPKAAVMPLSGMQTLYIIVQDQNLLPVSKAEVVLTIRMPDGTQPRTIAAGFTDRHGTLRFDYHYSTQVAGSAVIDVEVKYGEFAATTATTFRIWW